MKTITEIIGGAQVLLDIGLSGIRNSVRLMRGIHDKEFLRTGFNIFRFVFTKDPQVFESLPIDLENSIMEYILEKESYEKLRMDLSNAIMEYEVLVGNADHRHIIFYSEYKRRLTHGLINP